MGKAPVRGGRGAAAPRVPSVSILFRLTSLFGIFNSSAQLHVVCAVSRGRVSILGVTRTLDVRRDAVSRRLHILERGGLIHIHHRKGRVCCDLSSSRIGQVVRVKLSRILRWKKERVECGCRLSGLGYTRYTNGVRTGVTRASNFRSMDFGFTAGLLGFGDRGRGPISRVRTVYSDVRSNMAIISGAPGGSVAAGTRPRVAGGGVGHSAVLLTVSVMLTMISRVLRLALSNIATIRCIMLTTYFITALLSNCGMFVGNTGGVLGLEVSRAALVTITMVTTFYLKSFIRTTVMAVLFSVNRVFRSQTISTSHHSVRGLTGVHPSATAVVIGNTRRVIPTRDIRVKDVVRIGPCREIPLSNVVVGNGAALSASTLANRDLPISTNRNDRMLDNTVGNDGLVAIGAAGRFNSDATAEVLRLIRSTTTRGNGDRGLVSEFTSICAPIIMLVTITVTMVPPLYKLKTFDR